MIELSNSQEQLIDAMALPSFLVVVKSTSKAALEFKAKEAVKCSNVLADRIVYRFSDSKEEKCITGEGCEAISVVMPKSVLMSI